MRLFILLFIVFIQPSQQRHSLVGDHYRQSALGQFDNGYPQQKYESVLKTLQNVYGPIIQARGGELKLLTDWTDGAVNMWAWRRGPEYWLEIPGGMSRYYLITEEAFVVSICHELGHLLGGAPQNGEISFEGQADYFANQNCSLLLLDKIKAFKELPSDPEITSLCSQEADVERCQKVLSGSKSLSSYYAELENVSFPQYSTTSSVKVSQTLQKHPPAQCRLDTFKAGFFADQRPACWFK